VRVHDLTGSRGRWDPDPEQPDTWPELPGCPLIFQVVFLGCSGQMQLVLLLRPGHFDVAVQRFAPQALTERGRQSIEPERPFRVQASPPPAQSLAAPTERFIASPLADQRTDPFGTELRPVPWRQCRASSREPLTHTDLSTPGSSSMTALGRKIESRLAQCRGRNQRRGRRK
jgi:hypothetical protein